MTTSTGHEFDPTVQQTMLRVRSAYAALLASLSSRAETAIEVERSLGLNKKLAWQVFRVATASEALAAGVRVPGPAAVRQVTRAARTVGVTQPVIVEIESATAAFHDTVLRHAEDRSSFDHMVSAMTGDGLGGRDLEMKRAAFRANRQLLGRCCDTDLFTLLLHPGKRGDTVHMCSLRGLEHLYRLRPHVNLEVSRHRFDQSDGAVLAREPVDAPSPGDPVGLLRRFSTDPLPPLRDVGCSDGYLRVFAETSGLGFSSAVSCYLADLTRDRPAGPTPEDPNPGFGHIHEVANPARVLVQDLLVDERLACGAPELRILASRRDASGWPGDDPTVLLPVKESIERLGVGLAHTATPELPRYRAMLEHVTGRLGWDPGRFVVYRVRVEYPVLHSVVWVRVGF